MELNSTSFIIFLTITIIGYWSVTAKYRWVVLLLASMFFFFSLQPLSLLTITIIGVATYCCAALLSSRFTHKYLILALGLSINLGSLLFYKYGHFANEISSSLLTFEPFPSKLLLPIGMSFYTFQLSSYLIDIFRGTIKHNGHVGRFLLYLLFFPKFIAGPIEQNKTFLPQILKKHQWNQAQFSSGLSLFALGFFKKAVIADTIAVTVDRVFGSLEEYKGLSLVLIIFLYSWQILADFSGYTDMARGVARLFGYNLMENFSAPYFATSVRDFWRRWHISLSTWFRDYLYIPLGGSRVALWRVCINYLLVFTLCGMWHGATIQFLLWGLMHGILLSFEKITAHISKGRIVIPRLLAMIYTYSAICVSWVLFRANSLTDALYVYQNSLEGIKNVINPNYVWATTIKLFASNTIEMAITFICVVAILCIEIVSHNRQLLQILTKLPTWTKTIAYILFLVCIILLRNVGVKQFIYVQF